jgi:hypothetical protein
MIAKVMRIAIGGCRCAYFIKMQWMGAGVQCTLWKNGQVITRFTKQARPSVKRCDC